MNLDSNIRPNNLATAIANKILQSMNYQEIKDIADVLKKDRLGKNKPNQLNLLYQENKIIEEGIKENNAKKQELENAKNQKLEELSLLEKINKNNIRIGNDISKLESDLIQQNDKLEKIRKKISELEKQYQISLLSTENQNSMLSFLNVSINIKGHEDHTFGISLYPFGSDSYCGKNNNYIKMINDSVEEITKVAEQDSRWEVIETNFLLIKNKIENQITETQFIRNAIRNNGELKNEHLEELKSIREEYIKKEDLILSKKNKTKDSNSILCDKLKPYTSNNHKELEADYIEEYAYTMEKCLKDHQAIISNSKSIIEKHNQELDLMKQKSLSYLDMIDKLKEEQVKLEKKIKITEFRIKNKQADVVQDDVIVKINNIKKDLDNIDIQTIEKNLKKLHNDRLRVKKGISGIENLENIYNKLQRANTKDFPKYLCHSKKDVFYNNIIDAVLNTISSKVNINSNNTSNDKTSHVEIRKITDYTKKPDMQNFPRLSIQRVGGVFESKLDEAGKVAKNSIVKGSAKGIDIGTEIQKLTDYTKKPYKQNFAKNDLGIQRAGGVFESKVLDKTEQIAKVSIKDSKINRQYISR